MGLGAARNKRYLGLADDDGFYRHEGDRNGSLRVGWRAWYQKQIVTGSVTRKSH